MLKKTSSFAAEWNAERRYGDELQRSCVVPGRWCWIDERQVELLQHPVLGTGGFGPTRRNKVESVFYSAVAGWRWGGAAAVVGRIRAT